MDVGRPDSVVGRSELGVLGLLVEAPCLVEEVLVLAGEACL